jgi:glycerophosphoryl diester phosphodiesterase
MVPLAKFLSLFRAQAWLAGYVPLPQYQAHRGYHFDGALENTREALMRAEGRGSQMCEFDVRLTQDRVPILFHDENLIRVAGRPGLIHEVPWSEIQSANPKLSTLESILLDPKIKMNFNIELKSNFIWDDPLEREVASVVIKTQSSSRILFSSFNPLALFRISQYLPEVPRALLVSEDLESQVAKHMLTLPFLKLEALHFDHQMISGPQDLEPWLKAGYKVACWTVNDPGRARELLDWGVHSIISDELKGASHEQALY